MRLLDQSNAGAFETLDLLRADSPIGENLPAMLSEAGAERTNAEGAWSKRRLGWDGAGRQTR
jgi:hypothetical protein